MGFPLAFFFYCGFREVDIFQLSCRTRVRPLVSYSATSFPTFPRSAPFSFSTAGEELRQHADFLTNPFHNHIALVNWFTLPRHWLFFFCVKKGAHLTVSVQLPPLLCVHVMCSFLVQSPFLSPPPPFLFAMVALSTKLQAVAPFFFLRHDSTEPTPESPPFALPSSGHCSPGSLF